MDNFNVVNFAYSDQYSKAIEEKVTAQQNALTEQNKLAAVQFQAQQRKAQAQGEADAIKIQTQAISMNGGQSYLILKYIEKWNGQVALVESNNAMPIIDMRTLNSLNTAAGVTTTLINQTK